MTALQNIHSEIVLKRFCPAKINLVLEVLDKRSDGYHNIQTVFQKLRISDSLTARYASTLVFETNRPVTLNPQDNLVYKAALLLKEQYKVEQGALLYLEKNLPDGAGLGGGSSDAAQALLICAELWNLKVPFGELQVMAQSLGADVPLFLEPHSTYLGQGKGELLTPLPSPKSPWVLIATPRAYVSTALAYQNLQPRQNSTLNQFVNTLSANPHSPYLHKLLGNHFEATVYKNYPVIEQCALKIKESQPLAFGLCGSGASLYAFYSDLRSAQASYKKMSPLCRYSSLTQFLIPHQF